MHRRSAEWLLGTLVLSISVLAGCADTCRTVEPQFPPDPNFPADHRYTLDELIELSVHRNPSLDLIRYEAAAAQGIVDQVKALWLPMIRYDFGIEAFSNDMNYKVRPFNVAVLNVPITGSFNLQNTINYAQILTTFGKRTSVLNQAKMAAEIVRLQVLNQQDCVACEVAQLYYLICLSNDIDRVLDETLRRLRVFRQVATELNERGSLRSSTADRLEADLLINELEQFRVLTQEARQVAYISLKRAIGLNRDEPLVLRDISLPSPMTYSEAINVSATVVRGFLNRPELQQVNLLAAISGEQVNLAKRLNMPNVLTIDSFVDSQGKNHNILNQVDGAIASLVIDIPIYDPGSRARLRTAMYGEQASLALQKLIEQVLVLEIEATALDTQRSYKTLLQARRTREMAREHEQVFRQAYTRELIPASGLIIAIGLDAFARVQQLTAVYAYHSARARLNRVTANREVRYGW